MNPSSAHRAVIAFFATMLCVALFGAVASAVAASPAPVRIAVAPFESVADGLESEQARAVAMAALPDVAKLLAGRLALRDLDRLIAPSEWVAEPDFDPHAEQVRRWAHSAAVDTVVVGRVFATADAAQANNGMAGRAGNERIKQVEVVIRSGHSGAELYRHRLEIALAEGAGIRSEAGWAAALDPLAAIILGDLGQDDRGIEGGSDPPSVDPNPPDGTSSSSDQPSGGSDGGLASKLEMSGFTSKAPIEINADEAEIVSRGEDRRLIFQRNVRVKQANILLLSDRLVADYRKGESEPRQLVARGNVKIDQAGRKARCDKAVYQRAAQRLTCQGHAELIQGCDIVRGESIEFDLAGDQARVQGAASIVIRPESIDDSPTSTACVAGKGLM